MMRVFQRIKIAYRTHSDFLPLFILAASFRLMTLLLFRPGGFIMDWSEYYNFLSTARLSDYGLYPFRDFWVEYPPLFPWLFTAIYRLSLLIPPWDIYRFSFNTLLGLSLLPFEMGNLILVYLIALEIYNQSTALRCSWYYTCLFVPVYTLISYFDCLPLFFLLLALYLLLRGHERLAGFALGTGTMIKLIPVLVLPVGLRILKGLSKKVGLLVSAIVTIGLWSAPFLWLGRDFYFTFLKSVLTRSSWETIWAVLEGYYGYGVVPGDRLNPAADFSIHPSTLPWSWITLAFAMVGLWLYTRPLESKNKRKTVLLAALTLNLFFLYSKGYSPQFLVNLLPFVVLLLPNLRGVIYCTLLSVINIIEFPIFFVMLYNEHWILVAIVVMRSMLLLALGIEYGLQFFSPSSAKAAKLWQRASTPLLAVLLIGGCVASYPMGRAYSHSRYILEPDRATVIRFLNTQVDGDNQASLIFTEQTLYVRFYPFLRKTFSMHVVKHADEGLAEIASEHNQIWLLQEPEAVPPVKQWLDENRHLLAHYRFREVELRRYSVQPDRSSPPLANLGNRVRLLSYRIDSTQVKAGEEVCLTLYWQAVRRMDTSYTVFTHLLGEDGNIWGQKDNPPASGQSPTLGWLEDEVIEDRYVIPIQANTPPGTYQIAVGMYDPRSMERLPVLDQGGHPQEDRVLLPQEIHIK
jgi:hypothetical protein